MKKSAPCCILCRLFDLNGNKSKEFNIVREGYSTDELIVQWSERQTAAVQNIIYLAWLHNSLDEIYGQLQKLPKEVRGTVKKPLDTISIIIGALRSRIDLEQGQRKVCDERCESLLQSREIGTKKEKGSSGPKKQRSSRHKNVSST